MNNTLTRRDMLKGVGLVSTAIAYGATNGGLVSIITSDYDINNSALYLSDMIRRGELPATNDLVASVDDLNTIELIWVHMKHIFKNAFGCNSPARTTNARRIRLFRIC